MPDVELTKLPLSETLAGVAVGVVSSWGNLRARDRVSYRIVEHLQAAGAEVHLLLEGSVGPGGLPDCASAEADHGGVDSFRAWLRRRGLRAVVMSEYQQWEERGDSARLIAAKDEGTALFGYLAWERVFPEQTDALRLYDAVFSPHDAFTQSLHHCGVVAIPFRWGWRPPLPKPRLADDEPIDCLHISGSVDGGDRKGSEKVALAFLRLARDTNFRFRITSPVDLDPELADELAAAEIAFDEGGIPPQRVEAYQRAARVMVCPSHWEGIGLSILESLAAGTPVITTDGPPMNQWVRHKGEGLLVPTTPALQDQIAVAAQEFTVEDLVETMLVLHDRELLPSPGDPSRQRWRWPRRSRRGSEASV